MRLKLSLFLYTSVNKDHQRRVQQDKSTWISNPLQHIKRRGLTERKGNAAGYCSLKLIVLVRMEMSGSPLQCPTSKASVTEPACGEWAHFVATQQAQTPSILLSKLSCITTSLCQIELESNQRLWEGEAMRKACCQCWQRLTWKVGSETEE